MYATLYTTTNKRLVVGLPIENWHDSSLREHLQSAVGFEVMGNPSDSPKVELLLTAVSETVRGLEEEETFRSKDG